MLIYIILIDFVFCRIPFSQIINHKKHLPCDQLQDAKDYLDLLEHQDELLIDKQILDSYIGKLNPQSNNDITQQDLEKINDLLDYYDNTNDLDLKDKLLQELYQQVISMKNALDYDLDQLDYTQYDHLKEIITQSDCEDQFQKVSSIQPQKKHIRERIKLSNNSRTVKIPRQRKHPKKYVITRKPSQWDEDAIDYRREQEFSPYENE